MAKILDGISIELIENKTLLRLNMYISTTRYLEKGTPHITEVNEDNKEINIDDGEAKILSD